jgi:hypothetical protein
MASPDALEWLIACEEGMGTFKEVDDFDVVPRSKGRKAIGTKIATQGFTQVEGTDHNQTFATTSPLHAVLVLDAKHDLEVRQDKRLAPRVTRQVQGSHGHMPPWLWGRVGVAAVPAYTTDYSFSLW